MSETHQRPPVEGEVGRQDGSFVAGCLWAIPLALGLWGLIGWGLWWLLG